MHQFARRVVPNIFFLTTHHGGPIPTASSPMTAVSVSMPVHLSFSVALKKKGTLAFNRLWILFEDSRPASYAAWQDAKCGTWTAEENETQLDLSVQALTPGKAPKLSPTQQILYEGLLEKKTTRRDCMVKHKFNAIELIEKPKIPLTVVEGPDGRTFEFPYYVSNEEMVQSMSKIYPQSPPLPGVVRTGPDRPVVPPEQKGASAVGGAK
jgi:hypothetical protein